MSRTARRLIEAWRARFGLDEPLADAILALYHAIRCALTWAIRWPSFPSRVEDMVFQALPWTVGLLLVATLDLFCLGQHDRRAAWPGSAHRAGSESVARQSHLYLDPLLHVGHSAHLHICLWPAMVPAVGVGGTRADTGLQLALYFQHRPIMRFCPPWRLWSPPWVSGRWGCAA